MAAINMGDIEYAPPLGTIEERRSMAEAIEGMRIFAKGEFEALELAHSRALSTAIRDRDRLQTLLDETNLRLRMEHMRHPVELGVKCDAERCKTRLAVTSSEDISPELHGLAILQIAMSLRWRLSYLTARSFSDEAVGIGELDLCPLHAAEMT